MNQTTRAVLFACGLATLLGAPARAQSTCPGWGPQFVDAGPVGNVTGSAVFDDGTGAALYLGLGWSGIPSRGVVRWDGTAWSTVGVGFAYNVNGLFVHDDGSGSKLYAGTASPSSVMMTVRRWDGSSWTAVGSSFPGSVASFASFDDGTGPALYAAGHFTLPGVSGDSGVIRWSGSQWLPVGSMANMIVINALAVFDDGTGPHLYAGGDFDTSAGPSLPNFIRWNGTTWDPVSSGVNFAITTMTTFDDGTGTKLYLGGWFTDAGGVPVQRLASFDGTHFAAVGSVVGIPRTLGVHSFGGVPALYVSGAGVPGRIARWNGSSWVSLGAGIDADAFTIASFDEGNGPELFAGGGFALAGDRRVSGVARWDGAQWSEVGEGNGLDGDVRAARLSTVGGTRALYVGGNFTHAGPGRANYIARWDGTHWSPLGSGPSNGTSNQVWSLCEFDDGSGKSLYVGGQFNAAGGVPAASIARWNGTNWASIGAGLDGIVYALEAFDDGTGPKLYAGGSFLHAGAGNATFVARWNGANGWTPVGGGMNWDVRSFCIYDSGNGPQLHAGGLFTLAGGVSANGIARWTGSSWAPLGTGVYASYFNVQQGLFQSVLAMAVHDDGAGPALYAGGWFETAGGIFTNALARWDGSNWSAVGTGLDFSGNHVSTLVSHDDGNGTALYVGGLFTRQGGQSNLVRWRNGTYQQLDSAAAQPNPNGAVRAIAPFDGTAGSGASLYIGGQFSNLGRGYSPHFAEWRACPDPGTAFCFGDGSGAACPCVNNGATGHGCANSQNSNGALLSAGGIAALSADTIALAGSGMPSTSTAIFLQASDEENGGIGSTLFDGVRCTAGTLVRLGAKICVGGNASYPEPGNEPVSVRGHVPTGGATRYYQIYYRNAAAAFCPPALSNWSNGFRITWHP